MWDDEMRGPRGPKEKKNNEEQSQIMSPCGLENGKTAASPRSRQEDRSHQKD